MVEASVIQSLRNAYDVNSATKEESINYRPTSKNRKKASRIKRFLVGTNGCEVTGVFATPDKTAMFINIQHPGNWPADPNQNQNDQDATINTTGTVRPRASTVVIQKLDGGKIAV
ncbi:alkaline phosphatase PhoX [Vreelandella sp. V005]|uniref:alkaline phosphatase PhoX n=1 Tax=Vreelandella sp. V005 TaxID=3459608 RepID=UPI004043FEF8